MICCDLVVWPHPVRKKRSNNRKETKKFMTSVRRFLDPIARCDPGLMPLLPSGSIIDWRQTEICLSINPSAVRWLGTTFDSQTDSVKKYRIRLSVVNLSAVRLLEKSLDGQTDSLKK